MGRAGNLPAGRQPYVLAWWASAAMLISADSEACWRPHLRDQNFAALVLVRI